MAFNQEHIAFLLSEWHNMKSTHDQLKKRMDNLMGVTWTRFMRSYQSFIQLEIRLIRNQPGRTVSRKRAANIEKVSRMYPIALKLVQELQDFGKEIALYNDLINAQKEEIDKIIAAGEDEDANE